MYLLKIYDCVHYSHIFMMKLLSILGQRHFFYRFLVDFYNTTMSQKFCNILVCACLKCIYHITEAVQAMEATHCGW